MRMIPPANLPFPQLHIDLTAVGTDADTNVKTLMSYPLPANTLIRDGQGVLIKAWGTTGANANDKTVVLFFGSTLVKALGPIAINNRAWRFEAEVYRTGVGAQDAVGMGGYHTAPTVSILHAEPSEDETGAIVIKTTGENGTANANDVVCEGMSVSLINAS